MLSAIFTTIGEAITAFAGVLGNGFTAMIALFYADSAVTPLGILALIGLGVSLVWFAFNLVMRLFRQRA